MGDQVSAYANGLFAGQVHSIAKQTDDLIQTVRRTRSLPQKVREDLELALVNASHELLNARAVLAIDVKDSLF